MTAISTHVLDLAAGRPAAGIGVALLGPYGDMVGNGTTDADGRVRLGDVGDGTYRLRFEVDTEFHPEVVVAFAVRGEEKLHVPLLLSPFGYSTYRGS